MLIIFSYNLQFNMSKEKKSISVLKLNVCFVGKVLRELWEGQENYTLKSQQAFSSSRVLPYTHRSLACLHVSLTAFSTLKKPVNSLERVFSLFPFTSFQVHFNKLCCCNKVLI